MHAGQFNLCIPAGPELGPQGDIPCPCTAFTEGTDASPVMQVTIPYRVITMGPAIESFTDPDDAFVGIDYAFAVDHDSHPIAATGQLWC